MPNLLRSRRARRFDTRLRAEQLDDLPADAEMIRAALLDAFDRQRTRSISRQG